MPTDFSITVVTVYQGITELIDGRAARARRLQEVARQRQVQAPARGQCRRPPKPMAPVKAQMEARRRVEDRSEFPGPPELE